MSTSGGSARAGSDFTQTTTRVRFGNHDASPRLVDIPIREDAAVEPPESFTVSLEHPDAATLGAKRSAAVTIVDDDQNPPSSPPPPAQFTIGGTVDGLRGSGLILTNLGAEVPVAGNGSFTFPGTAASGQGYDVRVAGAAPRPGPGVHRAARQRQGEHARTSPMSPSTARRPRHRPASTLRSASGGRVSTPVGGGQGEAVVIQPAGGIVTAGWRHGRVGHRLHAHAPRRNRKARPQLRHGRDRDHRPRRRPGSGPRCGAAARRRDRRGRRDRRSRRPEAGFRDRPLRRRWQGRRGLRDGWSRDHRLLRRR